MGDFTSALSLFEEAAYRRASAKQDRNKTDAAMAEFNRIRGWPHIAARDAAMTVFHFGRTRDAIHETLGQCKTLRGKLVGLRDASKMFAAHFPDYVEVRHSLSHSAELSRTPAKQREHSIRVSPDNPIAEISLAEGGTVLFMQKGDLYDNTLVTTWEGKRYSCEISAATREKMRQVRDAYYAAFSALNDEGKAAILSRHQRHPE